MDPARWGRKARSRGQASRSRREFLCIDSPVKHPFTFARLSDGGGVLMPVGDMLDRMTGGLYRSTPHRVRNPAPRDRLSFPFFFDPNFFARVQPIDLAGRDLPPDDRDERWDKASVHAFEGTYGDYLLAKVGKVFPQLRATVL